MSELVCTSVHFSFVLSPVHFGSELNVLVDRVFESVSGLKFSSVGNFIIEDSNTSARLN